MIAELKIVNTSSKMITFNRTSLNFDGLIDDNRGNISIPEGGVFIIYRAGYTDDNVFADNGIIWNENTFYTNVCFTNTIHNIFKEIYEQGGVEFYYTYTGKTATIDGTGEVIYPTTGDDYEATPIECSLQCFKHKIKEARLTFRTGVSVI